MVQTMHHIDLNRPVVNENLPKTVVGTFLRNITFLLQKHSLKCCLQFPNHLVKANHIAFVCCLLLTAFKTKCDFIRAAAVVIASWTSRGLVELIVNLYTLTNSSRS